MISTPLKSTKIIFLSTSFVSWNIYVVVLKSFGIAPAFLKICNPFSFLWLGGQHYLQMNSKSLGIK